VLNVTKVNTQNDTTCDVIIDEQEEEEEYLLWTLPTSVACLC